MAEPKTFQNDQSSSDFIFESVVIYSSRTIEPVEVKALVSAVEIYEHMNKPYLTGNIAIADSVRVSDRMDFQGAEYIDIKIKRGPKAPIYKKTFVIDEIKTTKVNESSEVLVFHITEDIAYKANLYNVNKAYRGKPSDIIKKIAKEYLDKEVASTEDTSYQGDMQVIIPNLNPIESVMWLKKRTTDGEGYPYFLYSSFASEKLWYVDLGYLLNLPVINEKTPYIYSQSAASNPSPGRFFTINYYKHEQAENMLKMIKKGLIGGSHNYYNVMTASYQDVKFDIQKDVAKSVKLKNKRQSNFNVSDQFEFDELPLHEHQARSIYKLSSSGAYTIRGGTVNSYDEEEDIGGHKKKLVSDALSHLLTKSAIQIKVNGSEFMAPDGNDTLHYTIGNSIRLIFLGNMGQNKQANRIDPKKSGDYIIFAAKHSYGDERYHVTLTCAKVANYNSDEYMTSGVSNR